MPRLPVLSLMVFLFLIPVAGVAQNLNPHTIYETACARCHAPHAGAFVEENLEFVDGTQRGRATGDAVQSLLEDGHGRLDPEEIAVIVPFLREIGLSDRLFHRKCSICHGSANDLAHFDLFLRDGRLIGRYSGRDIAGFLEGHGRLDPGEIPRMLEVLERQRRIYQADVPAPQP
ncbi:hypothetical protein [Ovoidimarina sediminis]|uniref:hypothetical protein n=1 Tax=Ovoidimarina sediminis TaxID=3079856 RepID=UPI00290F7212|nr:hypothetical protein [Rhodophyticola sp. MJ-SS7]MDU8942900.1 hypothetical protein [Rhodophyticola sp. MJ-SS7]